jgi:hypothetical protein
MGSTTARVLVGGVDVPEVVSWEYTSDVLQIAETATFSVVCKDRKYRDALQIGEEVEFVTENFGVRGGAPTVRHRGNVIQRRAHTSAGGYVIDCVTADKGWHLQNNSAPLWFRLQGRTYADIFDPAVFTTGRDGKKYYFLDPSWGLRGVYWGDEAIARRRLKLGLAVVKQQAQKAFDQLQVVQVEAGETVAEIMTTFAKRINYLVNVSPDGYLCVFRPHDAGEPAYSLRLRDGDPLNNVISCEVSEDATLCYTEVTVVGDPVVPDSFVDPNDVNAQKRRGHFRDAGALPFLHRHVAADSDMYSSGLAAKQARWTHDREIFNSWSATYTVPEHFQNGLWWDADALASVDDDELGLSGNFYVQRVRCRGDKRSGDTTEVLLRRPGLLSAGVEIPTPSLFRADSTK